MEKLLDGISRHGLSFKAVVGLVLAASESVDRRLYIELVPVTSVVPTVEPNMTLKIDTSGTVPGSTPRRPSILRLLKLFLIIVFFICGCLSIVLSQLLIKLFTFRFPDVQRLLLNFTKTNFIILLVFTLQCTSPSTLVLSHDTTITDQSFRYTTAGSKDRKVLQSFLEQRAIVIANHQIYIDWVYLWFLAYFNRVGNSVYIIMKESLLKLPILGYGMKNYNFIFLSRKWEHDRTVLTGQLAKIDHYTRNSTKKGFAARLKKYWLILFPEGTNMSLDRVEKSNDWCDKIGTPRLRNILLPRVKGLYFATTKLSQTTKTIYNVTLGYSGIKQDQFAQDIFTISEIFLHGRGPKQVHIHFSKTDISEIEGFDPQDKVQSSVTELQDLKNMQNFEAWLFKKWYEKDAMMEDFYRDGEFGKGQYEKFEVKLKVNTKWELIRIFLIPALFVALIHYLWNFFKS